MRIGQLADRFDGAGDRLGASSAALADTDPGSHAFGGEAPGRLGEVGRMLYQTWNAALTSRSREAAAHAARLSDVADGLHAVERRYHDVETAAHARHARHDAEDR